MWQLKFDRHLDNQFLFSSFMFLLFFATQIWSPHVWGGLKWYHGVHKDCNQVHLGHGPCDDRIPIREKSEKKQNKTNKIWSQKVDKCFSWNMELMTKYLVLIFDIKILWKSATTKQTNFALKKLANVFF
jgi:hypothetical protein